MLITITIIDAFKYVIDSGFMIFLIALYVTKAPDKNTTVHSIVAAIYSTFPCPYWWSLSAGLRANLMAK